MNTSDLKSIPALEAEIAVLEEEQSRLASSLQSVQAQLKKLRKSLLNLRRDDETPKGNNGVIVTTKKYP